MKVDLQKLVERTISKHRLLEKGQSVLVAVSGGADSVALLLVLKDLGYDITALHCNFHLRGEESERDMNFVSNLCAEKNIPIFLRHFETKDFAAKHKISIEMAARELRYEWFDEVLNKESFRNSNICIAHHSQDQAETLLLNLIRGTGLRGLAGMKYKNGRIVRPLLDASKQDIEQYLLNRNQNWVTDSSNLERDAQRNRIRLDIIPLMQKINPQVVRNITMAAQHIQDALPIYERGLSQNAASDGFVGRTKVESLTELHEAITGFGFNSTQERNIWEAKVGAVVESVSYRLLKDRKCFIIKSKAEKDTEPILEEETIHRDRIKSFRSGSLYIDKVKAKFPLKVRKARIGDKFIPFGMKGVKLLSNYMTDAKMNLFEKEEQYVLTDSEDNILWIIGRQASNIYRITDETNDVLRVSIASKTETPKTYIDYGKRE